MVVLERGRGRQGERRLQSSKSSTAFAGESVRRREKRI